MTNPGSIAVAQTCPTGGNVQANLEEHLRLVAVAAAEGARIAVFPELSLTGYELGLADELAFSERDSRLSPLIDAAAHHAMTLIVGAPVRLGRKLHIGAFILSPERTLELYTKHHLGAFSASAACDGTVPPAEATVFQPGDRNPLIEAGGGIAAVAVCADIGRSSHPASAANRGARAYLASMFVIPSELDREARTLRGYAVRHSMTVAFANFGCPSGGLASAGRSAMWSESGDLLVQLDEAGAGVAVATLTDRRWRATRVMISIDNQALRRSHASPSAADA